MNSIPNTSSITLGNMPPNNECRYPDCKLTFSSPNELGQHIETDHSTTKNVCKICGYNAKILSTLKIHLRSHTRQRPFQCDVCNKGFMSPGNLNQHKLIHGNKRNFICSKEGCNRAFNVKNQLTKHEKNILIIQQQLRIIMNNLSYPT